MGLFFILTAAIGVLLICLFNALSCIEKLNEQNEKLVKALKERNE